MYLMGHVIKKNMFSNNETFCEMKCFIFFLCFFVIPNGIPLGIKGKNEENDFINILHMAMPSK
jgi:hypothetical protein